MLRRMEEGDLVMTHNTDRDPTEFFSVVGAPYVAEQHDDGRSHYIDRAVSKESAAGVAGLWLVLYGTIIGFSVLANSSAAKWINVAALLK
jgi:hypothetical protein